MTCNDRPTDCTPGCPDTPAPVLPRCDVALPNGTYNNATVVVSDGCIVALQEGRAPQYAPPDCCDDAGGGGGGDDGPCDCPPGEPGRNATISIGTTHSGAPGTAPQVQNVGTNIDAILEFTIPRGEQGGGGGGAGDGFTGVRSGIVFEGGRVQNWPVYGPVMYLQGEGSPAGVTVTASDPSPGGVVTISVDLSGYDAALRNWITGQLQGLQDQLDALASGGGGVGVGALFQPYSISSGTGSAGVVGPPGASFYLKPAPSAPEGQAGSYGPYTIGADGLGWIPPSMAEGTYFFTLPGGTVALGVFIVQYTSP